jgi:antitoxin component YwqK of YwqJK toxin-antitoxin module
VIAHYIEFYPSGDLKEINTTQSNMDELVSGYKYYPNGKIKSQYSGNTHIEEDWYETGMKEAEYFSPHSQIMKITRWYQNGQKKEETEMNDGGKRNGKWFEWDSLGHQTRKEFYAGGTLKR